MNVISDTNESCVDVWLGNGMVIQFIDNIDETNVKDDFIFYKNRIEKLAKVCPGSKYSTSLILHVCY